MNKRVSTLPSQSTLIDTVWEAITEEARIASEEQADMASFFYANVLNHHSFEESISFFLASALGGKEMSAMTLHGIIQQALQADRHMIHHMLSDLLAHYHRDAACDQYSLPLLYFKGYHALQVHRIAHWYWHQGRTTLALFLQHRVAALFDVDIHPAATFGAGIMLDHATGIVIGETAVIEDDVSILHGVTLGGSGCARSDRHPKIRHGVLLSAGAKVLGNIEIGENAKIGAGSLVLASVPPNTTVAGVPAKSVGKSKASVSSLDVDQSR